MTIVLAALFGLAAGSFAAATAWRLARGQSVLAPSCCESCGARLSPLQLIPVASFAAMRGRAGCCGARISPESTWTELACAGWFALCFGGSDGAIAAGLAITGPAAALAVLAVRARGKVRSTHA